MSRQSMFLQMMLRSSLRDRARGVLALLAVGVAAAVATALLSLYADVESKLHKEFRAYGANVIASSDSGFSAGQLARINQSLPAGSRSAPFAYAVAKTADQSAVIVAATDFGRARQLNGWWDVSAWPGQRGEALLGVRARRQLAPENAPFGLTYGGHTLRLQAAGVLRTGSDEESRVYISLADFEAWTGQQPNVVEIAIPGSATGISGAISGLRSALPGVRVQPVRQLVEAEASVLTKTRGALLGATVVILALTTLCLLATLSASVLERRKDFAVMRALGASRGTLHALFLTETTAFALVGSALGITVGLAVAQWIGQANFHAVVTPRWSVLPAVLAGTLVATAAAAIVPMFMLGKVQPATLLRGE